MSRDVAREYLDTAKTTVAELRGEKFEARNMLLGAIACALVAIAETQLEQLELARRVRTK